jgi:hypothetical protein
MAAAATLDAQRESARLGLTRALFAWHHHDARPVPQAAREGREAAASLAALGPDFAARLPRIRRGTRLTARAARGRAHLLATEHGLTRVDALTEPPAEAGAEARFRWLLARLIILDEQFAASLTAPLALALAWLLTRARALATATMPQAEPARTGRLPRPADLLRGCLVIAPGAPGAGAAGWARI